MVNVQFDSEIRKQVRLSNSEIYNVNSVLLS